MLLYLRTCQHIFKCLRSRYESFGIIIFKGIPLLAVNILNNKKGLSNHVWKYTANSRCNTTCVQTNPYFTTLWFFSHSDLKGPSKIHSAVCKLWCFFHCKFWQWWWWYITWDLQPCNMSHISVVSFA